MGCIYLFLFSFTFELDDDDDEVDVGEEDVLFERFFVVPFSFLPRIRAVEINTFLLFFFVFVLISSK